MLQYSNGDYSEKVRMDTEQIIALLIVGVGIEGIPLIVWGILHVTEPGGYGGFAILAGCWFIICIGFVISEHCAKYKFSIDGIWTKYPLEKWKLIPWREFQEVCVCYTGYSTRGESRAFVIICCVKYGEEKNKYGRWKTESLLRHRSVIRMDFTQELYQEAKECCPFKVKDLRETSAYRLRFTYKF